MIVCLFPGTAQEATSDTASAPPAGESSAGGDNDVQSEQPAEAKSFKCDEYVFSMLLFLLYTSSLCVSDFGFSQLFIQSILLPSKSFNVSQTLFIFEECSFSNHYQCQIHTAHKLFFYL